MRRPLLILICLVLLLALAASASAATRITELSQLRDGAAYTKEDMLAVYELGYAAGYRDSLGTGSLLPSVVSAADYILNTSKMKFHVPDCPSVGQMAERNKFYYAGSRDELLDLGYTPCGNCKP